MPEAGTPSTVWFTDMSSRPGNSLLDKTGALLRAAGIAGRIPPKALTAVKLHFGEKGNTAFIRPIYIRRIIEEIRSAGGKPFLTDTNTLYVGSRSNAVDHLGTAITNGFAWAVAGAPVVIADGLRGESHVRVPVNGRECPEVSIGAEIARADAMVVVSHFKGHELSGFGGALKNLGMGCASRSGKLVQHSTVGPEVDPSRCTGCGACVAHCPSGAIHVIDARAVISAEDCIGCADCIVICPEKTIHVDWNEASPMVQRKMVDHALGAVAGKGSSLLFVTFVTQISPFCDCYGFNDRPIAPDVGILASADPVALDQACADLVIRSAGRDPFRETHPTVDWTVQLSYAEEVGLGARAYDLKTL
ncbi:MAG: DUF362 domain-containing protein [Deltaproteobacteria bacterium]|nr:DUF362 domain-containing protein [Deltaproteobacteria bacterium]